MIEAPNHGFDPNSRLAHWHQYFTAHIRSSLPDWVQIDHCQFVSEQTVLPLVHGWKMGESELALLRSLQNPVICFCTNPVPVADLMVRLDEILAPGQYFVLHWDAESRVTATQAYWPFFLIEQRCRTRMIAQPRQYRISMLAGQVRPHRLRLWQAVRDLIQAHDVVVLNAFGLPQVTPGDPVWRDLPLQELPWSNAPEFLDSLDRIDAVHDTAATDHPAFRACVNITAETLGSDPGIFVTEKTWKALAAGCMCWHWPGSPLVQYMRRWGFRDWFGDSTDPITSGRDLFGRRDIWDLYHDNTAGIQEDIERFWDPDLMRDITAPAIQALESWLDR